MALNPNTVLQLNPNLVVWPNGALQFGFAEADGCLSPIFDLGTDAVQVLTAFQTPKQVNEVFRNVDRNAMKILETAIANNFLLMSEINASADFSSKFAGFRLADRVDSLNRAAVIAKTTRRLTLEGKSIFIIDRWLTQTVQIACMRWMLQLPYWHHDIDSESTRMFRHWISILSPANKYAECVPLIHLLVLLGRACFRGPQLKISRAHAYCIGDGDVQFAHKDFSDFAGVTILYFANLSWDQKWGSEMLFYGRSGEAEVAIEPRPGRIVAFRGDLKHRAGVPFRIAEQPRYTLVIRLLGAAGGASE